MKQPSSTKSECACRRRGRPELAAPVHHQPAHRAPVRRRARGAGWRPRRRRRRSCRRSRSSARALALARRAVRVGRRPRLGVAVDRHRSGDRSAAVSPGRIVWTPVRRTMLKTDHVVVRHAWEPPPRRGWPACSDPAPAVVGVGHREGRGERAAGNRTEKQRREKCPARARKAHVNTPFDCQEGGVYPDQDGRQEVIVRPGSQPCARRLLKLCQRASRVIAAGDRRLPARNRVVRAVEGRGGAAAGRDPAPEEASHDRAAADELPAYHCRPNVLTMNTAICPRVLFDRAGSSCCLRSRR